MDRTRAEHIELLNTLWRELLAKVRTHPEIPRDTLQRFGDTVRAYKTWREGPPGDDVSNWLGQLVAPDWSDADDVRRQYEYYYQWAGILSRWVGRSRLDDAPNVPQGQRLVENAADATLDAIKLLVGVVLAVLLFGGKSK